MRHFLDTVKVVDLTDFYLTREEYNRVMRTVRSQINTCKGTIYVLAFTIGWLIGTAADQKKRIDELEARLDKNDETAG